MIRKHFLMQTDNIERDSYLWNIVGSLLAAFQSVLFLMVLTRVLNLQDAGIFTIAYANANLFLTIGKYGMRGFQVSDVKRQFSFAEYRCSRTVTTVVMLVVSLLYVGYTGYRNSYSPEKSWIILGMCCFKAVDSIEDVFHGHYQQAGRLDVASKALTLRMAVTILFFCLCVVCSRDLLLSVIASTVFTTGFFIVCTFWTRELWKSKEVKREKRKVIQLLWLCFPLCAGAFLSFYIGNASKYAIDAVMDDEAQACYGFIAMPVFVIGLLNGFIFNPMIRRLSLFWMQGRVREFRKRIGVQICVVAGLTFGCIVVAYFLGVPVLSWMYHTDLSVYRRELLILLLGGGFLGLSGFLSVVITIIRFQKSLLGGYAVISLIALLLSEGVVRQSGILGASILYTGLMGTLSAVFLILLFVGMERREKE